MWRWVGSWEEVVDHKMCCSPLLASSHGLKSDISCCYFGMACCQPVVASRLGVAEIERRKLPWQLSPPPFRSRWKSRCFLQLLCRSTCAHLICSQPALTLKSLLKLKLRAHMHIDLMDDSVGQRSESHVLPCSSFMDREWGKTQQPLFYDRILCPSVFLVKVQASSHNSTLDALSPSKL